ncbi:MAG: hypothetical protein DRI65_09650 [Chloroflexota bacterium]|nr:MAG: hypothetical protein DRI65_09650 [Chloroflexota bacterium]
MTDNEKNEVVLGFVNRFPGKTIVEIETLIGSVVGITATDKLGLRRDEIDRQLRALLACGKVIEGSMRACTKAHDGTAAVSAATWWPG